MFKITFQATSEIKKNLLSLNNHTIILIVQWWRWISIPFKISRINIRPCRTRKLLFMRSRYIWMLGFVNYISERTPLRYKYMGKDCCVWFHFCAMYSMTRRNALVTHIMEWYSRNVCYNKMKILLSNPLFPFPYSSVLFCHSILWLWHARQSLSYYDIHLNIVGLMAQN